MATSHSESGLRAQELAKKLQAFSTDLRSMCNSVQADVAALKRTAAARPCADAAYFRQCLGEVSHQSNALEGQLRALEAVTTDTLSFEELVGHSLQLHSLNERRTAQLVQHLQQYGYVDGFQGPTTVVAAPAPGSSYPCPADAVVAVPSCDRGKENKEQSAAQASLSPMLLEAAPHAAAAAAAAPKLPPLPEQSHARSIAAAAKGSAPVPANAAPCAPTPKPATAAMSLQPSAACANASASAAAPPPRLPLASGFQTPLCPGLLVVGPPSPRSAASSGLSALSYSPGMRELLGKYASCDDSIGGLTASYHGPGGRQSNASSVNCGSISMLGPTLAAHGCDGGGSSSSGGMPAAGYSGDSGMAPAAAGEGSGAAPTPAQLAGGARHGSSSEARSTALAGAAVQQGGLPLAPPPDAFPAAQGRGSLGSSGSARASLVSSGSAHCGRGGGAGGGTNHSTASYVSLVSRLAAEEVAAAAAPVAPPPPRPLEPVCLPPGGVLSGHDGDDHGRDDEDEDSTLQLYSQIIRRRSSPKPQRVLVPGAHPPPPPAALPAAAGPLPETPPPPPPRPSLATTTGTAPASILLGAGQGEQVGGGGGNNDDDGPSTNELVAKAMSRTATDSVLRSAAKITGGGGARRPRFTAASSLDSAPPPIIAAAAALAAQQQQQRRDVLPSVVDAPTAEQQRPVLPGAVAAPTAAGAAARAQAPAQPQHVAEPVVAAAATSSSGGSGGAWRPVAEGEYEQLPVFSRAAFQLGELNHALEKLHSISNGVALSLADVQAAGYGSRSKALLNLLVKVGRARLEVRLGAQPEYVLV